MNVQIKLENEKSIQSLWSDGGQTRWKRIFLFLKTISEHSTVRNIFYLFFLQNSQV